MSFSLVMMMASTAVSAIGKMAEGQAQAASYRSQAQAQTYNAQVNRMNADQVSAEYGARESALRAQQAQFLGRQRATLAESGVGIDSPTATDLMGEDERGARLDDLMLRYEGQTKRTAYLNGAALSKYDSQVAAMNAGQEKQSGTIGAIGEVLGGVNRYIDMDRTPSGSSITGGAYGAGYTYLSNGHRVDWFPAGV